MSGDLETAIDLYHQSLDLHPTAEAHTFLGWPYSFGNPYNDIGAYLLEMGRFEEAIPWLEQATTASRYEAPHFPRFNLGRAFVAMEMFGRALEEFEKALALRPDYAAAARAVAAIKRQLN
jgi:Tfp pilus assembly protein PilF